MPWSGSRVDFLLVSGLRNRLEPILRAGPDLGLAACLALLWIDGVAALFMHLAFIFIALSAFARASIRGTVLRVLTATVVGGTGLMQVYGDGGIPGHDLLEVPLLAALALLFAVYSERRVR